MFWTVEFGSPGVGTLARQSLALSTRAEGRGVLAVHRLHPRRDQITLPTGWKAVESLRTITAAQRAEALPAQISAPLAASRISSWFVMQGRNFEPACIRSSHFEVSSAISTAVAVLDQSGIALGNAFESGVWHSVFGVTPRFHIDAAPGCQRIPSAYPELRRSTLLRLLITSPRHDNPGNAVLTH
ncbi:hypothetical protein K458DRAFT_383897 [Lentithecium fluviatile CBS 122367]|uniref:Uncharacterized protein n=1 Tax=Lentithecium fluviatile CBS 122367 TaxID=1168545 RepID=A0A6G1JFM5_9PLEO|nr:hypothetical protein K458DRAFT_383897 [Lentithecium fluviatile CBS 122367]